jgi:ketosteroid isomerase-like protein
MQHSQAVEDAVNAWCERISAGDIDGVAATLADDADAFSIGTQRIGAGREEWLESAKQVAQMGVSWSASGLRCWETADAGFAVGEITPTLPNGTSLPMRATAFLLRDGDAMRIFNIHFSWAVPDEVAWPQVQAWREQLGLVPAA